MREQPEDIARLEQIISHSNENAGAFLRSSFEIPSKTLSAEQLVRKLGEVVTVVLGTVTSEGKPRTAPVLAVFYRGAFHIPTISDSLRARHVRNNPEVSLSLYEGNDFAVVVHGTATAVTPADAEFSELAEIQVSSGSGDVREWGEPVFLKIHAERLYSFARYPEQFPGSPLLENQQIR